MSGPALPGASQALVAAALGGLLSASLAACGGSSTTTPTNASGGDGDPAPGTISTIASADGGTIATTEPTTPANGDSPIPRTECLDGVYAAADRQITSSSAGTVAQDDFQTRCAAANGIYETQPNCGGSNSCRGMSYDSNTETLTEHTCRATNTCAGFSCVVCS
jgi:hypothetical protein